LSPRLNTERSKRTTKLTRNLWVARASKFLSDLLKMPAFAAFAGAIES